MVKWRLSLNLSTYTVSSLLLRFVDILMFAQQFMYGFQARLVLSALGAVVIYNFPVQGMTTLYYYTILAFTLTTSFSVTTQFVSQVILLLLHIVLSVLYIRRSLLLYRALCTVVNFISSFAGFLFHTYQRCFHRGHLPYPSEYFCELGGHLA